MVKPSACPASAISSRARGSSFFFRQPAGQLRRHDSGNEFRHRGAAERRMLITVDSQRNRLAYQRIVERLRGHIEVDPDRLSDAEDIGDKVSLAIDAIDPLRLIDSPSDVQLTRLQAELAGVWIRHVANLDAT